MHPIIETAARLFGVELADLLGPSRAQHLTQARQAVAYALRQETPLSLVEIGKLIGRTHTTIMHAVGAAERRAVADPGYALTMSALLKR